MYKNVCFFKAVLNSIYKLFHNNISAFTTSLSIACNQFQPDVGHFIFWPKA